MADHAPPRDTPPKKRIEVAVPLDEVPGEHYRARFDEPISTDEPTIESIDEHAPPAGDPQR